MNRQNKYKKLLLLLALLFFINVACMGNDEDRVDSEGEDVQEMQTNDLVKHTCRTSYGDNFKGCFG